jgi:hypothetical protein
MVDHWRPQACADFVSLEDIPPAVSAADAQPYCNFIVWEAHNLPSGCRAQTGTVRREAPPGRGSATVGRSPWSTNNSSAYRYEIIGAGRRLRIKQFHYDWTFPALDHPCLWKSETRSVPIDDRYVLWIGVDYSKHVGASARIGRTLIELSVLEGEFTDDELVALYRSMRPVSPEAAAAIAETPFAELSYWARYDDAAMINVPVGLWTFRRPERPHEGDWHSDAAGLTSLMSEVALPMQLGGFAVDSAARFTNAAGASETEVVYTAGPDRGHELRVVVQRAGGGRLVIPSPLEGHPCASERVSVGGAKVDLAWIDVDHGPWDAVWHAEGAGLDVKLLSTTAVGFSRSWFLGVVAELSTALTGPPTAGHGR